MGGITMVKKAIAIGIVSLFVIGGLLGIFSVIPEEVEAPGPTYVSGIISTNTTWTEENSPYIIIDNTTLMNRVILTMEAGTEVRFKNNTWLSIRGKLHAKGNSMKRVIFTNEDPRYNYSIHNHISNGDYSDDTYYNGSGVNYYVHIETTNGGVANISYAKFEFSSYSSALILADNDDNILENKVTDTLFINNKQGLYGGQGWYIKRATFENNWNGIHSINTHIYDSIFKNNTFGDFQGDGDYFNCSFIDNEYGVYTLEGAISEFGIFLRNKVGMCGQIGSINNTFTDNEYGIIHYEGPIYPIEYNNIYNNEEYNIKLIGSQNRNVPNNWWGTTNITIIDQYIYDIYDDPSLGEAIYEPFITQLIPFSTNQNPNSSSSSNLSISSITLSKYRPSVGEEVTIFVEIQNSDNIDYNTVVRLYDGDPNYDGIQIGIEHIITIMSDSLITISQNWFVTTGNHTIYVYIDEVNIDETIDSQLDVEIGDKMPPMLVLSTGDINIYRFEPGETRTISVDVTCYLQTVNNVRLKILDHQNLTIDSTITPPRTMSDGETIKFYLRITAPQLPEGVEKFERDIIIQVVGDNGIFSNAEELDIVVSKDAVSFFNPVTIAGAVATGSLATLGAAAAASRRNENWKYLLLLSFAVPLYTRIHGKKTLDNFVRGQVFGHIQSTPGTHFNEIKKTLQLGNGNLAYHLQKLEKEGFVKSKRDKRYRRFYPVGVEVPEEDGIKLSKTQESILDYIERNPKSDQKKIAQNIKESQQTISYNINVLVREGFLTEEKFKGMKRYEIMDDNT
jgi:DNA-binding MarR family transcriptional regulator